MSDTALGLALGQGEEADLSRFLAEEADVTGSFFSVNYDMGAYMDGMNSITDDLVGSGVIQDVNFDLGHHDESQVERAFREVFIDMAGRNHLEFSFDRDGIAIDNVIEFDN